LRFYSFIAWYRSCWYFNTSKSRRKISERMKK